MKIKTKHFGEVDIEDELILSFEEGIFGFEDNKSFVIVYNNKTEASPFCWLQSTDDSAVCLPLIDPLAFFPEYNPEIPGDRVAKIGELKEEDLKLFTVVVVPEEIKRMTTNLMAPILVNVKTKKGLQVVVADEEYEIRHNLYEQIMQMKEATE